MFFDSEYSLFRIIIIGVITYIALIIILRLTGKRTLSKLNAFDFIITIALGSTAATILISKEVTLTEGLTALLLLVSLQFIITFLSVKLPLFKNIVTARPTLVFYRGKYLKENMKKVRITRSEILQAVRNQGIGSLNKVSCVILETNGELSVLGSDNKIDDRILEDVVR